MSIKAKLMTTIAALCMVICLLSVGIWAATSVTVTLTGTVSFVAEDVHVTVSGEAYGEGAKNYDEGVTKREISDFTHTWAATDPDDVAKNYTWAEDAEGDDIEGLDLTFSDKYETIIVKITVKNENKERAVKVKFDPTLGGVTNVIGAPATGEGVDPLTLVGETNIKASYARTDTFEDVADSDADYYYIAPEGEATYTITLKINNTNNRVNAVSLDGVMTIENTADHAKP